MSAAFVPVTLPDLSARPDGSKQRGFAAGYAEGLRHAAEQQREAEAVREARLNAAIAGERQRTQQAVDALARAAQQLNTHVIPALEQADQTLIETALDLAEAVLVAEVNGGHVTAAQTLRRAVDAAGREQVTEVLLSPADVAALAEAEIPAGVTVAADPSLAPGEAIARLRHGWFDARITASLDRARTVLLGGAQ
ncbi:FliH/SctL family protein [Curtobacterium sp. MCBD17_040]|uniref:FliH/SctL family protein n=1 Tax=Curtobacterium sp. MCBD17_040 TaxID=2175674 RepID=UPI000DA92ACF|nr:FliH/SctL family protein [Curtobacterium sp. MCBD17_040]WIB65577.1 FliH/SctL family protein [Curtobacterium sp. MCBD17_040]